MHHKKGTLITLRFVVSYLISIIKLSKPLIFFVFILGYTNEVLFEALSHIF